MQAKLAELELKLQTTEQRLQDTQKWAHQSQNGKQFAEALITASQEMWQRQQAANQQASQTAFPQLSEEERELLVADPDLLMRVIRGSTEAGQRQLLNYLAPQLQAAQTVQQVLEPLMANQAEMVKDRARAIAAQSDIDDETFEAAVPYAEDFIRRAAKDQANYAQMRLNPTVFAQAVIMARNEMGGVPVTPSPKAPSIGVSSRGGGTGRPAQQQRPSATSSIAMETARKLGLDPKKLMARYQRERAEGRR